MGSHKYQILISRNYLARWWWALGLATIVVYWLAMVVTGVGGLLLLRDLFQRD